MEKMNLQQPNAVDILEGYDRFLFSKGHKEGVKFMSEIFCKKKFHPTRIVPVTRTYH